MDKEKILELVEKASLPSLDYKDSVEVISISSLKIILYELSNKIKCKNCIHYIINNKCGLMPVKVFIADTSGIGHIEHKYAHIEESFNCCNFEDKK